MQRKFIEYDLPLEEISEESAREKHIRHGHPSTVHVWWSRKPLAVSRAIALATLLNDPGPDNPKERREIKRVIEKITPWEAVKNGNSEAIEKAQKLIQDQYGDDPPKVLDPFAGGGSIPLETLRLGAETYATDYNPVAVFIDKATMEWPQKFGFEVEVPESLQDSKKEKEELSLKPGEEKANLLSFMVKRWANKVLEEAREEIGQFYPEDSGTNLVGKREVTEEEGWIPIGYYYNRTVSCQNPSCNAQIPLAANFWLAKKKHKKIAYRPIKNEENNNLNFEILHGQQLKNAIESGFDPNEGTVSRANVTCPVCGQVTEADRLRKLGKEGKIGERMVAVIFHHPDQTGKKYRLATEKDRKVFNRAKKYLDKKLDDWSYLQSPLPDEEFANDPRRIAPPLYGFSEFQDIFNGRQKLALVTFMEKIRSSYVKIKEDVDQIFDINTITKLKKEKAAKAILGYLACLFDLTATYLSSVARYRPDTESIERMFGRQAIPLVKDYGEINPFAGSRGDITQHLLPLYLDNIELPKGDVFAAQSSATELDYRDNKFDFIITDPPYYDSVPYAALSDFFYVLLKRTLGEEFSNLFSTPLVPKTNEALMEPARHESKKQAKAFFEKQLRESFEEMYRVLKKGGIATVIYAYKTTEGWENMLNGLIESGFVVSASWPVHTEMKSRMTAARSASLASSIYMVCRKMTRDELGFWKDLKPEIENKVEAKLNHFWKEGIVGGDLFISAIGPGMEIFSQYEEVQKYSGEKVSTRELLTFIRSITTDFVVNRLLKEASPSEIDKESQFYLAYRWTYLDNKVEYDAARKIASGMGADIEKMDDETGFVKKTRKYVQVYGPEDRTDYDGKIDEVETSSMVDAMHKSLLLWEDERKEEINELLAETGYAEQGSFWQLCQAVSESLVQGNDEKKKLEGFLMGRDKYVQSAKEMNEQDEKTKDMFEEE